MARWCFKDMSTFTKCTYWEVQHKVLCITCTLHCYEIQVCIYFPLRPWPNVLRCTVSRSKYCALTADTVVAKLTVVCRSYCTVREYCFGLCGCEILRVTVVCFTEYCCCTILVVIILCMKYCCCKIIVVIILCKEYCCCTIIVVIILCKEYCCCTINYSSDYPV